MPAAPHPYHLLEAVVDPVDDVIVTTVVTQRRIIGVCPRLARFCGVSTR
jgi:hypothetical protein